MSELDFIEWIKAQTTAQFDHVMLGPGDDTAVLNVGQGPPLLLTVDMFLEGTHFQRTQATPEQIGHKVLAASLSDIAAMAGRPLAALASVGCPRALSVEFAQALYRGMKHTAEKLQTPIVGGDMTSSAGPLSISVTVVGRATERGPVLRSGAQAGDWIFVTGALGGSLLGHHLTFTPRVVEARALHDLVDLHAMIDISDGLARDLNHVCQASGLGAALREQSIPIADAARQLSQQDGRTALDHALNDGEDFELLFTVNPEDGQRLLRQPPPGVTLHHIGTTRQPSGLVLQTTAGELTTLNPGGYEHRFGDRN